jgi:hypothetical protein
MLKANGPGFFKPESSGSVSLQDTPFSDCARMEFDFITTHPLVRYLPHGIPEIKTQVPCADSDTLSENINQKKGSPEVYKFLSVYTQHITTRHRTSNDLHDMGYYRLKVPMERAYDFRWFNLSRRVSSQGSEPKNHPHIYADGHACLGNANRMLEDALGSGKLYDTIQIGIRFLTSCQVADPAGVALGYWPLYPKGC